MIKVVFCFRIPQKIDQILEIGEFLLAYEDITRLYQNIAIVKPKFCVCYFSISL